MTPNNENARHRDVATLVQDRPTAPLPWHQNLLAAIMLITLLAGAVATHAGASHEIGDDHTARQSYGAFVIEAVASIGLSMGLMWLALRNRSRGRNDGEQA